MKNNVREQLIHTMFTSLYHEGYHACNLNDLLNRAGSSKGGLYHYFGSKKELAMEATQSIMSAFIEQFWTLGLERHSDPIVALEELLNELPHASFFPNLPFEFKYGSPLNNLIQELSATDEEFSALFMRLLDSWKKSLCDLFERSKKSRILREEIDIQQLADFIIASIEGSLGIAKARRDENSYHTNTSALITYLNTLRVLKKTTVPKKRPRLQSLFE
jgi:TetR/AcrR family transcriptional repressor of nem operon